MNRQLILTAIICIVSAISFHNSRAEKADKPEKTEAEGDDNGYSQISIFAKAVQLLRQDYVDGDKTSYHDLINAAMKGMLASLDPHSQFMDPEDFRDMQDDTRSRFNGLGIEVSMKNGLPTVVTAMEDTPASKAGILSGDQILKINGWSEEKREFEDAKNFFRGRPGKKITSPPRGAGKKEKKKLIWGGGKKK